tara:strand:- start:1513 stop:2418 length:906 start_codon:yes stop_codon:yes gene_type:complete
MDIKLTWLKDFLALAETKNFSRAAKLRFLSQPAFSRRIQSLENNLNCNLINRYSQPVRLTEQGIIFEKTVKMILSKLDHCFAQLNSLSIESAPVIFAATHTLSTGVFPTVLQHLNQQPSKINTKLKVADADDCIEILLTGQCDYLIAFSDPKLNDLQVDSILLDKVQLLPVCKADSYGQPIYKLTNKNQKLPYLAYQQNIYLGRVVAQLINHSIDGLDLHKIIESSMADSLKMMALKGLGITWLPEYCIRDELENKQLALCDPSKFQQILDVKIYKNKKENLYLEPVWQCFKSLCSQNNLG